MCSFVLLVSLAFFLPSDLVQCHVALKFPPARKYDLDFLDNVRTKSPCGMPKGSEVTDLSAGSDIDVLWHLSYPHRGGHRIQLLDSKDRPVMDLTPVIGNNSYISSDVTAQSQKVFFPEDLVCHNCTIRLLRQANEWSSKYMFWSCADVNILPKTEFKETCSGRGRRLIGRCRCDALYYGNVCQFKNECDDDKDCGLHGKCIDTQATTDPRKRCFCESGWFGEKCKLKSPVRETNVDLSLYSKKMLSDTFTLYWRILKDQDEIEAVMVVKGTSYVALGWRPAGLDGSCKAFPYIPSDKEGAEEQGESEPIPDLEGAEHEPHPEIEPEAEPETSGEPHAQPEAGAEPEPKDTTSKTPKSPGRESKLVESGDLSQILAKKGDSQKANSDKPIIDSKSKTEVADSEPLPEGKTEVADSEPLPEGKTEVADSKPLPEGKTEVADSVPLPEGKTELADSEPLPEGKTKVADFGPHSEDSSKGLQTAVEKKSEGFHAKLKRLGGTNKDNSESVAAPETLPSATVVADSKQGAEPEPEGSADASAPKSNSNEILNNTKPNSQVTSSVSYSVSNTSARLNARRKRADEEGKLEGETKPVEPESAAKPEPESGSEPEPDGAAEPAPESAAEPVPESAAEPEPGSEAEPEPDSSPEPEPGAEVSIDVPLVKSMFTPKGDFHPMDCMDMVIGFVQGSISKIGDYYTRDRSTPREDDFYGGKSDLTAALGYEKDGVTTVLFRKKLRTKERSDQPIVNGLMDVIWAQGQEADNYVHNPKSGLETEKASVPNFYGPDELKYHGHGSQRGKVSMNFYEEDDSNLAQLSACGGEWSYPRGCSDAKNCEYRVTWDYSSKDDRVNFTIETTNYDRWTGIGFSDDLKMSQTDAVIGWVSSGGRPFIGDYWISGYVRPSLDTNQDIYDTSGVFQDGVTTLKFSRKRQTLDSRDKAFNDTNCLYMFYIVKGGLFNPVSKRINKHDLTPIFSSSKVCIRSCGGDLADTDGSGVLKGIPEKPTLEFDVGIKLVDLGSNFLVPEKDSADYQRLSDRVKRDVMSALENVPGFKDVKILDLESIQAENKLVAKMNVILDENEAKKGDSSPKAMLMSALKEPITKGQIGALRVDPYYLQISDPQVINNSGVTVAGSEYPFGLTLKMLIILACIAALVLVAFIQAICSIRKYSKNRQPRNQKERLISNSAWKDYSTGSTNYAYENFETDDPRGAKGGKGSKVNGIKNGYSNSNGVSHNDTRSLNRPQKNGQPRTSSGDKFTYSLPRTNHPSSYSTNTNGYMDRPSRGYPGPRGPNELQPDFYFMPSQRKYSGEVVRVYVDYNQQK